MAPGGFWNGQNPALRLELLIVNCSDRLTFLLLHKLNPLVICYWFHSFNIQGRKTDWGTEKSKSMSRCAPLCVPYNKRPTNSPSLWHWPASLSFTLTAKQQRKKGVWFADTDELRKESLRPVAPECVSALSKRHTYGEHWNVIAE